MATTTTQPSRRSETEAKRRTMWPPTRWAGLGALVFLALLIVQNLIKAAINPANGATAHQILNFAHQDAWTVDLLFVTYVIGLPALFAFVGGLTSEAADRDARAILPGRIGQFSVVAVAVLFGLINIMQVTLVAARGDLVGDPTLVQTLWVMHNAIFMLNLVAVAVALFGLGRAASISGIVPAWMGRVSLVGALAMAASALPVVAEVHGSNLLGLGLAGFLCWLVFLALAGIALLKIPEYERPPQTTTGA